MKETKIAKEKCSHDKCKRIARGNSYCNKCIQLNTEMCNYCSEIPK